MAITLEDGTEIRTPVVEVKNLNSFKAVKGAIEHEMVRQVEAWKRDGRVMGRGMKATRGWDDVKGETVLQREKEDAHDYRYLPDPDLLPVEIDAAWRARLQAELPEPPLSRRQRYVKDFGLAEVDAENLTAERDDCFYFEACVHAAGGGAKAGFAIGKLLRNTGAKWANERGTAIAALGVKPERVKQELLQHEIVVESLGGETQEIEVSATQKINLDKLLEAIQLQAEILDLRANPDRAGEGTVIESKLDRGRGPVATVLVQKGTLKQGDIVVAGAEWGRVRAMLDDKGRQLKEAGPSLPVEILGLSGVPAAGETFVAVEDEARAREISDFRQRKLREKQVAAISAGRGSLTDMLARIQAGAQKEVAVVVKADVQGSAEAIGVTLGKIGNDEVKVRVLLSGVGQITETDIQLAKASDAVIVAFNVRATTQARELAQREGVDIRYYSIIYQVADDIETLVRGKLAPVQREKFLGYAQILQVFEVKRLGNVAGCRVTEGVVKRGCGVRLLRDGVVIHQGELSTLRRFKDDVKEVTSGYECGMGFANYNDIRVGDQIECYETETVAAEL
jgi:translation initiation factor IF-2